MSDLAPGEAGAGGFRGAWNRASADGAVAEHIGFQYTGIEHQTGTAVAGMWLFLVTELLFFGGLFLVYAVNAGRHPAGTLEASRHAELWIGSLNTVLLISSSAAYSLGLARIRAGDNAGLRRMALLTAGLGIAFLALKGIEWGEDFGKHLFPGPGFALSGVNGAELFWCFYFIATALHGIHMIVGVGLVAWIVRGAGRGAYSPAYHTPVEAVGLYWSFVDMVWIVLFPCIYLVGR